MDIEKVIQLAKKRGFIFPSSEIYGSLAGFFDYGHYGFLMKRNIENSWIRHFVLDRDDMIMIDGSIITNPNVWRASGHEVSFNDPLVECKRCHKRFRVDVLIESKLKISVDGVSKEKMQELINEGKIVCPDCKGELTTIKLFNLMFKTHVGATEDENSLAYLRPETAQLIFVDFKNMSAVSRKKLPFGIAQIGKSFRNEIAPRNFVFRCREFNQMEIEFFINPKSINKCPILTKEHLNYRIAVLTEEMQIGDRKHKEMKVGDLVKEKIIKTEWHAYWVVEALKWIESVGIKRENLRIRQHTKTELSHYSLETWDVEYNYPWGWKELLGLANRTDFDLKQHMKYSKEDLGYFDQDSKEKIIPHVIEPSFGLERLMITLLIDAYSEKEEKGEVKVVLKLDPRISPISVGVYPLMKRDGMDEKAKEIADALKKALVCEYDEAGSIGKRYARADESGVPLAVTVDYQTLQDQTVTLRDRDTTKQIRVKIDELPKTVGQILNREITPF
jgi:glycyl-tRNA synthetase